MPIHHIHEEILTDIQSKPPPLWNVRPLLCISSLVTQEENGILLTYNLLSGSCRLGCLFSLSLICSILSCSTDVLFSSPITRDFVSLI